MGHEGHLRKMLDEHRRDAAIAQQRHRPSQLRPPSTRQQDGIPVDIVTLGGNRTYKAYLESPGITEVQVGSYLLMDTFYKSFVPNFQLGLPVRPA